jgi:flagellin
MTAQIRGLNMAVRNLNDGINMMQTAEGAMIEQSNMLQRMRELAVQSMNGTYSSTQRGYLDLEFQALASQVDDISNDTMWNDQVLLNADSTNTSGVFTFQAGQGSGQTISVTIGDMGASALGISTESIGNYSGAASALTAIGLALETINEQRATIGAGINRMEYAADNLTNVSSNATQSRSTIMDTDYALATTQLAKTQIIQQAATAMLAQANQQPQQVMQLLKG